MAIFNSYVKLPEGNLFFFRCLSFWCVSRGETTRKPEIMLVGWLVGWSVGRLLEQPRLRAPNLSQPEIIFETSLDVKTRALPSGYLT
jgi:hypothetical protein